MKLIIEVRGGIVQEVYADKPDELVAFVIDHDNLDEEEREPKPIPVCSMKAFVENEDILARYREAIQDATPKPPQAAINEKMGV